LREAHALAEEHGDLALRRQAGRALARALHNTGAPQAAADTATPLLALPPEDGDRDATLEHAGLLAVRGTALFALSRHGEAEADLRAALAIRERLLGLAHRQSQSAAQILVAVLSELDRNADAL